MSGHSKWSQIKRKKGALDEKRGQMFGKLLRAVEVASREGGTNIEGNMTLASAVQKARDYSVPWDNIERAIKRGGGDTGGARYEEVMYEGFGPGGVAILIQALTDNRNRTGQEVRHAFSRMGGNLGDPGSVAWMFDRRGLIEVDAQKVKEDDLLEKALESGATDVRQVEKVFEVTANPDEMEAVRQALERQGMPVVEARVDMVPQSTVKVEGKEAAAVLRLIEALEEQDDVQSVYSNYDIADEVIDAITAA